MIQQQLGFLLLSACFAATPPSASDPFDGSPGGSREFWLRLIATSPDTGANPKLEGNYWWPALAPCQQAMADYFEDDRDFDAKARFYVDQFGKHGPEADLRWLLAFKDSIVRTRSAFRPPHLRGRAEHELFFALQEKIWEYETRRFAKDAPGLQRFWRLQAWYGELVPARPDILFAIDAKRTQVGLANAGAEDYWFWARQFVLLAHATGRDDSFADIDLTNVQKPFDRWYGWLSENYLNLEPDPENYRWCLRVSPGLPAWAENPDKASHLERPGSPFADWPAERPFPSPTMFNEEWLPKVGRFRKFTSP